MPTGAGPVAQQQEDDHREDDGDDDPQPLAHGTILSAGGSGPSR
jgi:hypothetical protein